MTGKILKMVNHPLTIDQLSELDCEIVQLSESLSGQLQQCPDDLESLQTFVDEILNFAETQSVSAILAPGGSPAFMAIFCQNCQFPLWFSHSVREFSEKVLSDGSVQKTNIFAHKKFIVVDSQSQYRIL